MKFNRRATGVAERDGVDSEGEGATTAEVAGGGRGLMAGPCSTLNLTQTGDLLIRLHIISPVAELPSTLRILLTALEPPANISIIIIMSEPELIPTYLVNKLHRFLPLNTPDRRHFLIVEQHPVKLISCYQHLWTKRRRYELPCGGQ